MAKQFIVGLIWCIVLYFGACMVTGALAGGIAGSHDPAHAAEVGARAGNQAVMALRSYFVFGAVTISILGTALGVLPGTRSTNPPEISS